MFPKSTQFEKLLEAVPDALVGVDQKGVIRFVNHQSEVLFGSDRGQLVGEHIETLVPEPLWQVYAEHRQDDIADSGARSLGLDLELSGRHQDGTEFPINVTMSLIDTGDVLLVIREAGDVSAQQRAVADAGLVEAIMEYSDDAIIGATLEGTITSWNPAAEKMYGYLAAEIIGRSGQLLIPEDRAEEMNELLVGLKAGHHVEHLETTRVRKDGTVFPVSVNSAPIYDQDGTIVGVSAAHRDVTEQRQAFEAAQRFSALVRYSNDVITSSTLEGIITSWNPGAERLYGYSSEEIIGKHGDFLTPRDRAGEINTVMEQFKAGKTVHHFENTVVRKDGTLVLVSITISPIYDEDGQLVGVSAIHHDMTERNQALEAAQLMAAIVNGADDAIISRTLDGTLTTWNPAAERMFGYSSEEIIGKPGGFLTPQDRAGEAKAVLEQLKADKHVAHLDTERVRKDGTVIPVSLTISPVCGADGTLVGASTICRDLSELKHAAEHARSVFEAGQDPLMTIASGGQIYDVNQAAVTATGVSRDQLIGTEISRYFTDADRAEEAQLQAFEQGSVTDYPLTLRHQDGTLTEVLYNASVYRDSVGKALGVVAAIRDVTQQNLARAVERRMAAIVESSGDAIISKSLDGTITSWNPAAELMFGYSAAEIVGKPGSILGPPDRASEIADVLARLGAGQDVEPLDTVRVRRDGTVFPVSLTVTPLRGPDGEIMGGVAILRDVSELRRGLEAAERMAAIVEGSQDAIISKSLDGTITSWNPAAARMYGYSSEEVVGKSIGLLIPKDRPDEIKDILAKVKAGQRVERFETERVRKDGTVLPVSLIVSPIRDPDGTVVGAATIAHDVTQLRQALALAQDLIEASSDAMVGVDQAGVIQFVNGQAELLFGYDRDELVGQPVETLVPESSRAVHPGHRGSYVADPVTRPMGADLQLTGRRRDGTEFPVDISLSSIQTKDGLLVTAAARDLTEQVESARTLAEVSRQYRLLAENASDVVFMAGSDRRITWIAPNVTAALGWDPEELVGTQLADLFRPDYKIASTQDRMELYTKGHDVNPEGGFLFELRTESGDYRWMSGHEHALTDPDGTPAGVVGGLRDVNDLVKARQEAQGLSDALQASNESLRDFVAVASHDLRSPLVTIAGFTKILTDNWATLSDEARRKQLAAIGRGVDRLSTLTNDLLSSAKVEGEAEQPRPEHVRLTAALASYLEANREKLGAVGVRCPPGLVAVVDPAHLTRILDNYLTNAFAYGEPPVHIEAERVGDFVELRVRDHGPGVPPELVSRLFTKFDHGLTPATRATQGTGLGLSIVKALAEANHGDVRYQEAEPTGGCFVVRLPAAAA